MFGLFGKSRDRKRTAAAIDEAEAESHARYRVDRLWDIIKEHTENPKLKTPDQDGTEFTEISQHMMDHTEIK